MRLIDSEDYFRRKKMKLNSHSGKDREYIDEFGMTQEAMKRIMRNVNMLICEIYSDVNTLLEETGASKQIRDEYEIPNDHEIFEPCINNMKLFQVVISWGTPYGGSTSAIEALKDIGMSEPPEKKNND